MAAVVKLTVKSDFASASADLKKFGTISEAEAKKIKKFTDSFKSEQIDKFEDRTRRATAAVKATRGPVEAAKAETRKYRSEIEKLIKKGLDPQSDEIKKLTTRYKQLEKEMLDIEKAQKKTQKGFNLTQAAMTGVAVAAANLGVRAVGEIAEFTRASLEAASAAEEIEGKFGVVFADIGDDAKKAAATISEDFDLAISTVNKLLGDTGDILTGIGFDQDIALNLSEQVGTLALDLASFTNFAGGAEGASAALTKALLGEAESVKALGIVIRQDTKEYKELVVTLQETENVTLVQAKALAALQIATEQSKNAIGDYARTAESTANVQRTLDEQIKRSKEAWGDFLNEGITPVRKAFRDFLKETNDAIASESNIANAVLGRDSDIAKALTDLRLLEIQQQKMFDAQATGSGDDFARVELRRTQARINQLEAEKEVIDRINAAKSRGIKEDEIKIEIANKQAERDEISLSAFEEIEKRRFAALSSEEKQIENLQQQIEKWSEFKNIIGVQELLNSFIEERNSLTGEEIELNDVIFHKVEELALVELKRTRDAIANSAERKKATEEAAEQEKEAAEEAAEAEAQILEERKQNWIDFSFAIVDSFTNIFSALDQLNRVQLDNELALIDQRLQAELEAKGLLEETEKERLNRELQEAFAAGDTQLIREKQEAVERLSIVEKFEKEKAQAEYKAALSSWRLQLVGAIASGAAAVAKTLSSIPFPFNIPLGIAQGVASGVQIAAVSKSKPQPPAFAEGGSFRTSGPQTIQVGDNVGGEEDVTINPVSSTGFNQSTPGNGFGRMPVSLVLENGESLNGYITDEITDGNILVDSRSVVNR